MWDQRCNRSANPVAINDGNFMNRMICGVIVSCLLASGALAQTRYFLFPSEVPAFTAQYARMVNVFGIAHSVQTSDAYGIQFSLLTILIYFKLFVFDCVVYQHIFYRVHQF